MNRKIIALLSFIVIFSICICSCNNTDIVTDSAEESATEPDMSEWDRATLIWISNTDIDFELRVRPGVEYTLVPDDDNAGCTFKTDDGSAIYLTVQGLDYENSFEQMILYFKSLGPEKLSVGKKSSAIITVFTATETEIVYKLSDVRCLTTKAISTAVADEFFSNVMIRVNGEDYSPLDLSEEFEAVE